MSHNLSTSTITLSDLDTLFGVYSDIVIPSGVTVTITLPSVDGVSTTIDRPTCSLSGAGTILFSGGVVDRLHFKLANITGLSFPGAPEFRATGVILDSVNISGNPTFSGSSPYGFFSPQWNNCTLIKSLIRAAVVLKGDGCLIGGSPENANHFYGDEANRGFKFQGEGHQISYNYIYGAREETFGVECQGQTDPCTITGVDFTGTYKKLTLSANFTYLPPYGDPDYSADPTSDDSPAASLPVDPWASNYPLVGKHVTIMDGNAKNKYFRIIDHSYNVITIRDYSETHSVSGVATKAFTLDGIATGDNVTICDRAVNCDSHHNEIHVDASGYNATNGYNPAYGANMSWFSEVSGSPDSVPLHDAYNGRHVGISVWGAFGCKFHDNLVSTPTDFALATYPAGSIGIMQSGRPGLPNIDCEYYNNDIDPKFRVGIFIVDHVDSPYNQGCEGGVSWVGQTSVRSSGTEVHDNTMGENAVNGVYANKDVTWTNNGGLPPTYEHLDELYVNAELWPYYWPAISPAELSGTTFATQDFMPDTPPAQPAHIGNGMHLGGGLTAHLGK